MFVGDYDRWIHAYDVRNGDELWRARLGTAVMGFPLTYEIDGVQYLAVGSTRGGGSPSNVPDVLTPELSAPDGANAVYVFLVEQYNQPAGRLDSTCLTASLRAPGGCGGGSSIR